MREAIMLQGTCPDRQTLVRFLAGHVDELEFKPLEDHFSNCPECLAAADELSTDDTFVASFRREIAEEETADPHLQRAINHLLQRDVPTSLSATSETIAHSGNGEGTSPAAGEDVNLSFLTPGVNSEELGRLGDYRILRLLGAGGMGVVLEAEDPGLQRRVAIKAIRPGLAGSKAAAERFLREARSTAAIENDHIVSIYQVSEADGVAYLAMQFLRGESLESRLKREIKLPLHECLRIARETAQGLAAAHARRLLHRDIKPDNIWLEEPAGRVKIVDFGLARAAEEDSDITASGAIVGTPKYMAPEQARGEPLDARCDLWSLGVVLYRCLTGELPFLGTNVTATLLAISTVQQAEPLSIDSSIPSGVSDLVMRLLEKDPAQRIDSATSLIEMIQELELQQATAAVTPELKSGGKQASARDDQTQGTASASPQQDRRSSRRPFILAAAALSVAGFLLAGVMFLLRTPDGTLKVQVSEPNVQVYIDGHQKIVLESAKHGTIELRPGKHNLAVKRGDIELYTEQVTIKSNDETIAEATWTAGGPQADRITSRDGPSPLDKLDPAAIPPQDRFDWQSDNLVAVLGEHRGRLFYRSHNAIGHEGLALSPDGKTVATVDNLTQVYLWDAQTLQEKARVETPQPCTAVAFSPDGRQLAVGCSAEPRIVLYQIAHDGFGELARAEAAEGMRGGVNAVAFTPDGNTLISCGDDKVIRLWDVSAAEFHVSSVLEGHLQPVLDVAVSPDGTLLASCGKDKTIRLWNLMGEPKLIQTSPEHPSSIQTIDFSPDGRWLACVDEKLKVWLRNPSNLAAEPIQLPKDGRIAFSPDGRQLVVAGRRDASSPGIQLFDLSENQPVLVSTSDLDTGIDSINSLAFGNDLLFGGGTFGIVRKWRIDGRKIEPVLNAGQEQFPGRQVAFAPGEHALITEDFGGLVSQWEMDAPRPEPQPLQNKTSWIAVAGHWLVLRNAADAIVTLRRFANLAETQQLPIKVYGLAVSQEGGLLATWNHEQVQFWDLTGPVPRQHSVLDALDVPNLSQMAVAPGGRTLAMFIQQDGKRSVLLWDLTGGKAVKVHEVPIGIGFRSLQFSPDGTHLLGNMNGVYECDVTRERPEFTRLFFESSIVLRAVTYAPDGTVYAVDTSGRILHLQNGLSTPVGRTGVYTHDLAVSSDGRYLATANGNGTYYILRLPPKEGTPNTAGD